jgi:nitrite reductase (NADH) large subunit
VAPLFEQAKVCANHLAEHGVARYQGSMTSTKLKVTGIDLFSAGDFMGGAGTESGLFRRRRRHLQKAGAEGQQAGAGACCTATPWMAPGIST